MNYEKILVTGGSGFIGSNFIHYLFKKSEFTGIILNVDKLTYAGNQENLKHVSKKYSDRKYFFERIDIANYDKLKTIFQKYNPDIIVHFAAESHVDRSIIGPKEFIRTNIIGTFNLLECARKYWDNYENKLFHHISTDEVYGSLHDEGFFYENTPYDPHSPYSASKASSDHLVSSYFHTYGLPITISNCSNNYGLYQFPEKLIPLMINNMLEEKSLPVYGDGKNIRDWLYVEDHCRAIWEIIQHGKRGETYNVGGENEICNIDLVNILCEKMALIKNKDEDYYKKLITFVKDRPGHDWRYAINMDKIKNELNFQLSVTFEEGITKTIKWYQANQDWIENIKSGEYRKWINKNYGYR
ncbi:MAG: dTDP-glucose 4,6-dehydratase [Bacteroidales bacterium]|nr:dTDP-glucose 4,6-dehydratase [Bacteroidales bacterium]